MTHFFETTAGVKIEIQPIDMLDLQLAQDAVEKEFRERGKPIEPPTYEVELLGGEIEHHRHTEQTIVDATEEEKEQWRLHKDALERLQEETQQRTAFVFLEGMIIDLPEDDTWIKRRKKLFGEEVPTDEDELKLYYVNKVLLKTPADKDGLMLAIQKLSMTGVSEEAIDAMEALFRRQMEQQGRSIVEALQSLNEEETKGMVLQPDNEGRDSSQGAGVEPEPVQKAAHTRPGRGNSAGKRTKQDGGLGELSSRGRGRQSKT